MNNEQSDIERAVMNRVRRVHRMRPFFSGTALALAVFVLALWGIGREVWVAKVLENGPQDLLGKAAYFAYAFEHTRILVQALSLASFGAVIYLARETARVMARSLEFARL